jgi:4-amino-4-deoxy-L-arabinose transferase-like glycosyltransferase
MASVPATLFNFFMARLAIFRRKIPGELSGILKSRRTLIVAGLIVLLAAEMWFSVLNKSQTNDEAQHLSVGYFFWTHGDFSLSPEHPPLARLVASLPLLPLPLKVPSKFNDDSQLKRLLSAESFLYGNDADALLFRARVAISSFTIALALMVFAAGAEMFGYAAGLFGLVLLVFEPNILANGPLVATDAAVTCCFFTAIYAFYRYAKNPTITRLALCGLAAALALGTKYSGVLLCPILILLAGLEIFRNRESGAGRQILFWAGSLCIIGLMAAVLLWSFYGFRFSTRTDGLDFPLHEQRPLADYLVPHPIAGQIILAALRWRLLPESYLEGIAVISSYIHYGPDVFLLGKHYTEGQWFYYPVVFVIKSTLGVLALLALLVCAGDMRRPALRREVLFLAVPAVFFFAVCLTVRLDQGLRYLLPVYPFLILLAGAGAASLAQSSRRRAWIVGLLLVLHVASSARAFPNYPAYSNEIWGGPANTYKVLTDANVDMGGGLKEMRRYINDHHITQCWFAYSGPVDPKYYHIPCRRLPSQLLNARGESQPVVPGEIEGPVFVSATEYSGVNWGAPGPFSPYKMFTHLRPTTVLGGAFLVYEGHFAVPAAAAISHMFAAYRLADSGQLDQAMAEFVTALTLAPESINAHFIYGTLLVRDGRFNDARAEFDKAVALARKIDDPTNRKRYLEAMGVEPR